MGCHTMQIVARNAAKLELDSTSAAVGRYFAREVAPCVRALSITALSRSRCFLLLILTVYNLLHSFIDMVNLP